MKSFRSVNELVHVLKVLFVLTINPATNSVFAFVVVAVPELALALVPVADPDV